MDIKITDKSLRKFLKTSSTPEELAHDISLCGPTFDRIHKLDNDYLYEIEAITNRIDTASAQGVARDSAAILNQMGIKSAMLNDPYQEKINLYPNLPKTFHFVIEDQTLAPRFTAVSLENIQINESPEETKELLKQCGERPINNVVDITNELTLLYGMPSHIFDLDKLATQKLLIRESKKGEEVVTLDNQKNKLEGGDIVIEDGAGRLVDLCGVMGGAVAEVDEHTKNILLIVPLYHPKKIRRTSLNLQKRTLAAQIYEKQPDSQLCLPVLMNAIKLMTERADARVSSTVFDSNPKPLLEKAISLNFNWVNKLIGIDISTATISSILEALGFVITKQNDTDLVCTVPSWRYHDINIKEDLVEEIARVYGYSKLPPILPCVNLQSEKKDPVLKTESLIKNILSNQGFNEIYNSSLVSEDLIKKAELVSSDHLKLTNALSQDYEYLRTSLVPSLLQNIKNNQGKSEEPYYLYELSNVYLKTKEKLPHEVSTLAIVCTKEYREVKGYLELLLSKLNLQTFHFQVSSTAPQYFLTENTAEIISGDKVIGFIGIIKPTILHNLGINSNPIVIEIVTSSLADKIQDNYVYKSISEFPEVVEQITVSSNLNIGQIIDQIYAVSKLVNNVSYTNSFESKHSFKVTFSSAKNNLTQAEVNETKAKIQALFN